MLIEDSLEQDENIEIIETATPESSDVENALILSPEEPHPSVGFEIFLSWAHNKVAALHAESLTVLTANKTSEERDTWPVKMGYAALNEAALADSSEDGAGLDDRQKSAVSLALKGDETINQYLAKVRAKQYAFEFLAFQAEGFKRNVEEPLSQTSSIDEIRALMSSSGEAMEQTIIAAKAQLSAQ